MLWAEGKKNIYAYKKVCDLIIFYSMVLNPNGAYYSQLKDALKVDYEDLLWPEDVLFLERNSRTFKDRSRIINENTEALCDFLVDHKNGMRKKMTNLSVC